jgi:hypothetical protein
VLSERPSTLAEAAELALWSVYLPSSSATRVEINHPQGGVMRDVGWVLESVELPEQQTLQLLVLAYERAELIATRLVPFSIGPAFQREGEPCAQEGALCDYDGVPLVCVDERCRSACFSNEDCDDRSCSPPQPVSLVRVCL